MSSDKNASKRGKVIISSLLNKVNREIAIKYRKLSGYPAEGFFNVSAHQNWLKKHPNNKDHFHNFLYDIVKSNSEISDSGEFYLVWKDLFLFGHVHKSNIENLNATGCEWLVVTHDDVKANKKMKEGLYIKIALDSDLLHIKKFLALKDQKKTLQYLADLVRVKGDHAAKTSRKRSSIYEQSNFEILHLRSIPAKELSMLSKLDKRLKKDEHIAVIMKQRGRSITPGSIRKIIQRYKNRVQEL